MRRLQISKLIISCHPLSFSSLHRILQVLCTKLWLDGDFNFVALAKAMPGYIGAGLSVFTGAVGVIAVERIFKQLTDGMLVLPEAAENISQDIFMAVDSPPTPPADITPSIIPSVSLLTSPTLYFFHRAVHTPPLTPAQLAPLCNQVPPLCSAMD
jgi:ribosome biogenesis ATPase